MSDDETRLLDVLFFLLVFVFGSLLGRTIGIEQEHHKIAEQLSKTFCSNTKQYIEYKNKNCEEIIKDIKLGKVK